MEYCKMLETRKVPANLWLRKFILEDSDAIILFKTGCGMVQGMDKTTPHTAHNSMSLK